MLNEDQAFSLLKRRIFLDRGFACEQYKENYLKRRIAVRMRATEADGYLEYLQILRASPAEYTALLNELTVNVTQFFRDADVYEKIREHVIPKIIDAKESIGGKSFRIWSAGCASGEEPYSIAILVDDILGRDSKDWNLRVIGSDIDERSLEAAKRAEYMDVEMLEGIEPGKYFEISETRDGKLYRVVDRIKRKVRFEKTSLLDTEKKRRFDLIMCRNVLIYFDRDVQSEIIEYMATRTSRRGFLVLGKSETMGLEMIQVFKAVFPRERIYELAQDYGPRQS